MNKWIIIAALIFAGIVAAVKYGVEYGGKLGTDTITFADGRQMDAKVFSYARGVFVYRIDDLDDHAVAPADLRRIDFSRLQKDKFDKHSLTTPDGKQLRCRVLWYENGRLALLDPAGRERIGSLDELGTLNFHR